MRVSMTRVYLTYVSLSASLSSSRVCAVSLLYIPFSWETHARARLWKGWRPRASGACEFTRAWCTHARKNWKTFRPHYLYRYRWNFFETHKAVSFLRPIVRESFRSGIVYTYIYTRLVLSVLSSLRCPRVLACAGFSSLQHSGRVFFFQTSAKRANVLPSRLVTAAARSYGASEQIFPRASTALLSSCRLGKHKRSRDIYICLARGGKLGRRRGASARDASSSRSLLYRILITVNARSSSFLCFDFSSSPAWCERARAMSRWLCVFLFLSRSLFLVFKNIIYAALAHIRTRLNAIRAGCARIPG